MNPQIAITDMGGGRVGVSAPYSPALINRFRALGGKWEKPFWTFQNDAGLMASLVALWGNVDGHHAPQLFENCRLNTTGGQVMCGGYLVASGKFGKVEYGKGISVTAGACVVCVDGTCAPSHDFAFQLSAPVDFDPSRANLEKVTSPPPKGSKKFPTKKPFSTALATPTQSAASVGNMIDLDVMDTIKERADNARDVITLVLAMLEDGTVDARKVQQRCRHWLGWEEDANRELASVTMHGVPTGFVQAVAGAGTPLAGPVGAPVPAATVDPFEQLKAMFG